MKQSIPLMTLAMLALASAADPTHLRGRAAATELQDTAPSIAPFPSPGATVPAPAPVAIESHR